MQLNPASCFTARAAAMLLAWIVSASSAAAVPIESFHIYAQNNVMIGVGSIVGTPGKNSLVGAGTMVVGVGDASLNGTAGIYGSLRAGDDVALGNNTLRLSPESSPIPAHSPPARAWFTARASSQCPTCPRYPRQPFSPTASPTSPSAMAA